jgi:hypothetical protein
MERRLTSRPVRGQETRPAFNVYGSVGDSGIGVAPRTKRSTARRTARQRLCRCSYARRAGVSADAHHVLARDEQRQSRAAVGSRLLRCQCDSRAQRRRRVSFRATPGSGSRPVPRYCCRQRSSSLPSLAVPNYLSYVRHTACSSYGRARPSRSLAPGPGRTRDAHRGFRSSARMDGTLLRPVRSNNGLPRRRRYCFSSRQRHGVAVYAAYRDRLRDARGGRTH